MDNLHRVHYIPHMITTQQTETFNDWLKGLNDPIAFKRIVRRIALLQAGHFGDSKSVGDKVSELRIDHGPGYRVYWTRQGGALVILLAGGTKQTQQRDIDRAKKLAAQLE
ncbi:type II toxin-antitoxin system RelE/ParE family toxin [Sphingomonas sp. IW22]|uniref:type II toxin-antitoxin system RelE/ParE family toxin n=1 Tax=Sphingomonas sp. IW22 TaxID=3242489 RepID=UPI003522EEEB